MRVIAFVNTGSGDNNGQLVMSTLKNFIGNENVFDIKADKGPDRGLTERASDSSFDTICVVAGGDGTFSWVATAIERRKLDHIALLLIPLGSGNDMSRALGWGKTFPGLTRITKQLRRIMTSAPTSLPIRNLDVWRLSANHAPEYASDQAAKPQARPLVCNYLSLGADAHVELCFNEKRWNNPERYQSRLGNISAHAFVGLKYACRSKSRKLFIADHVESLHVNGELIDLPPNLQALLFLNIPSYAAGMQPWGFIPKDKQTIPPKNVSDMYVDDHQFEVIGMRGLNHFSMIRLFGTHGVRIAQGNTMKIKLKSESIPFQVDGEPWEQKGGEVALEPGNEVRVLHGPAWKPASRKRAKFYGGPSAKPISESSATTTTDLQDQE